MVNLATLIALKHREDLTKAAFCEAWFTRHFCSGSPGHSRGSFGWLARSLELSGKKSPSNCTLFSCLTLVHLPPVWCPTSSEQHFWNMFCILNLWLVQKQLHSSKETTSLPIMFMWLWEITSLGQQFRLAGLFWETTFPYVISFLLVALRSVWETTWPPHL